MKADLSRDTYRRQYQFARVLMQQGRVQLDADWNEQVSILLDQTRMLAADLIGPHGGPAPDEHALGLDLTPLVATRRPMRVAVSNSFGFGGQNTALVFRRWDA